MDILNLLLNSGMGNNALNEMVQKSGLDANSVNSVISAVGPIFMQNANENLKSSADSSGLLNLINGASLGDHIDTTHGNELLGFLTGSKENSRALASDVGAKLGLDAGSIQQLLPMIAPLVAGMLNKQVGAANLSSGDQGSVISLLTGFLDQNKDGSIVDDIFRVAGNFFGKK